MPQRESESSAIAVEAPEPPAFTSPRLVSVGSISGRFAVVGMWVLLTAFYMLLRPAAFLQPGTYRAIFGSQQGQALIFLGLALIVVFVVGEFDLSIASNLGLAATVVPVLNVLHGWPVAAAVAVAVVASVVVGVVNGLIVVKLQINPIVVTLGMATLLLGIALLISHANTISGISAGAAAVTNTTVLGLPLGFYYALAASIVGFYVLTFTPLGQHLRFIGSNPEVARLAGIPVSTLRIGAYAASGLLCGVGGVLLVLGLGSYDPSSSGAFLLPTFSAVFLGTAIVQPGRFNPLGMVIAVYFLQTGILGLQILGFTGWVSDVFYGAALMLAVTVSTLVLRRSQQG
ncbi:autoinducer 2 ABC transporter permease LsrD [Nonomuraea monospora]|uniref:Autoinducer 2 ABC transporter permease LsrD n=1 Tax=Nonomuraea monospora TaxID=568818 RepID=A0ABP5Q019_9ACTN